MSRKILLVSWAIPPITGGSAEIVENLAQNFSKDELVVLGGKRLFHKDPVRSPQFPKVYYHFTEINVKGRGDRYFKKIRAFRFKSLINRIKKIIDEEKIDYVLAVYPDDFYCLAACRAAKEKKLPFSSYFHNTYVENKALKNPEKYNIQDEIFEYSQNIFVMSDGMKRYYESKYKYDKFISLVHTFNAYPDKKLHTGIPGNKKDHYKLVAIGNFNDSNMDATTRFLSVIKNNPKYSLSVYTHVPKLLLRQRGLDVNHINHMGLIDPKEVNKALQDFDICILTHGFKGDYGEVEYKTIFPTRTIPFLLSGKPIFAHSPSNSFLNDFLNENECAMLVDKADKTIILENLEKLCSDSTLQQKLVDRAIKTSEKFYGPNISKKLIDCL